MFACVTKKRESEREREKLSLDRRREGGGGIKYLLKVATVVSRDLDYWASVSSVVASKVEIKLGPIFQFD